MKDSKHCHSVGCVWGHRHELLGLILLIIATILTVVSYNGFGILAMFIVGAVLCCYKYWHFCHCHHTHDACSSDAEQCHVDMSEVIKETAKTKKK